MAKDANLDKIINMRIARTIEALEKNNMNAVFVPGEREAAALLRTLLTEGESVAVGGSATLSQLGLLTILRSGSYNFLDRYAPGLSKEQTEEVKRQSLLADTFITSSNAITENGLLYNVDGNSNRVAAMLYGPKRVLVFAGYNKIVPTLADAVIRVKTTAAPANSVRLDMDTFCAGHGQCMRPVCDARDLMSLPAGACQDTICCNSVIMGRQRKKGRITVIIVGTELGF